MIQRNYFGKLKLIRRVDTRLPDLEYQELMKQKGEKKMGQFLRELIINHNNQIRLIRENYSSSMNGPRTISIKKANDNNNEQSKNQ